MLKRLPPINFVGRRDVFLVALATIVVFGIVVVWSLLAGETDPFRSQNMSKYFLTLVFFAGAALVGLVPFLTKWGRQEDHRLARLIIRVGIALQIFAVLSSLIGLLHATNPQISVPVGFSTFTAMLVGLLAAGFAANTLAPAKA